MRERSEYHFDCAVCGRPIVTEEPNGTCPKCGVAYRIDGWQNEDEEPRP